MSKLVTIIILIIVIVIVMTATRALTPIAASLTLKVLRRVC